MNRGIFITAAIAVVGSAALNLALYSIAHAGGPGELVAIAAFEWNPLVWPWPEIITVILTILGALAAALRIIAPMTKTTRDDEALGWLEVVRDFIARVLVPKQARANLGLSTGKGGVGDQPYPPPPPPFSSGGKSGGDAA
jgi:hypothetical protein